MRLRRSDCNRPGFTRRRAGKGFTYLDEHGRRLGPEERVRIAALAIPPAWTDVWISPDDRGHIQATGIDAAGRRQYRYHDAWRANQDNAKFDAALQFARLLPRIRTRVQKDLARRPSDGPDRDQALALAIRMLDLGLFRIGGEAYADMNGSYGLATLEKSHVSVDGKRVSFDYPAKSGQRRHSSMTDARAAALVKTLLQRRGGGRELLAYRQDGSWRDVVTADINGWLKEIAGEDVTAKTFRTWHATVLAAVGLAAADATSTRAGRKRVVNSVVKEVAHELGNTPAVARKSYIDPRVLDRYGAGETIKLTRADNLDDPAARHRIERRVVKLLS
ncbi:MAG TPA: DNA topoisomerase IB [Baekduia sp.]|nr:DNA topoisomerase IB [Baekduia sp.]